MNLVNKYRTIIAFVSDLFFQSKIDLAAKGIGYTVQWIEKVGDIDPENLALPGRQYAERLDSQGAMLIERMTSTYPILVIFDLNNPDVPWRNWIALIKSTPATRRIPVLCFCSHKELDAIKAAKDAGADGVIARSRFTEDMPKVIKLFAREVDLASINQSCLEPLTDLAILGLQEFNRGEYFEAHETLEAAWNTDETPGRELYRAILQISVAYLQIERGNYRGAIKMFLRVRQWIDPLPDNCRGVNIAKLRVDSNRVHHALKELGSEKLAAFDFSLLKPIEYST